MAKPNTYDTAKEIFLADLARNLFPNNQFILQSRDWSAHTKGKQVNWSESGGKPGVIINRTTTALTPAERTDIARYYEIDEYQSNPTKVAWTDEMVVNYNKRQDILSDHQSQTEVDIVMRILYNWVSGASGIVRTSGGDRPAQSSGTASGKRKALTADDFADALSVLERQDLNGGQLFALLPTTLLNDVRKIPEFKSKDTYDTQMLVTGAIGTIYGIQIFKRSSGIIYNNATKPVAQNPKADNTFSFRTPAATDNESVLIWNNDYVTRSLSPDSLVNMVDVHGGTEFSLTTIAGGSQFKKGGEGIVSIVEAAA